MSILCLACGNSDPDLLIHCCVLHTGLILPHYLLWHFKGGVSFLIREHGYGLLLLDITALFAETSLILEEVQVSLLQSHSVPLQTFSICHLQHILFISFYLFFIFLLDYVLFVWKEWDGWRKKAVFLLAFSNNRSIKYLGLPGLLTPFVCVCNQSP